MLFLSQDLSRSLEHFIFLHASTLVSVGSSPEALVCVDLRVEFQPLSGPYDELLKRKPTLPSHQSQPSSPNVGAYLKKKRALGYPMPELHKRYEGIVLATIQVPTVRSLYKLSHYPSSHFMLKFLCR